MHNYTAKYVYGVKPVGYVIEVKLVLKTVYIFIHIQQEQFPIIQNYHTDWKLSFAPWYFCFSVFDVVPLIHSFVNEYKLYEQRGIITCNANSKLINAWVKS